MSQHIFASSFKGKPVNVVLGWDSPLQHYFMEVVVATTSRSSSKNKRSVVYSSLSDTAIDGGSRNTRYFWDMLSELGIGCQYSLAIEGELVSEQASNEANRIVRYPPGAARNATS